MSSLDVSARLRYLNESAHLLAIAAPETSRHLMLSCNALMLENDIPLPEPPNRKACSACGTIMILGWEGTLKTESLRTRREKNAKNTKPTTRSRTMVYECKACSRKTRQPLKPPTSRYKSTSIKPIALLDKATSGIPSQMLGSQINASSTNASGRKRKKTKNSGLEALLAKKKASEAFSTGLDLMDFMKKV